LSVLSLEWSGELAGSVAKTSEETLPCAYHRQQQAQDERKDFARTLVDVGDAQLPSTRRCDCAG
jgi:hypothetical protein